MTVPGHRFRTLGAADHRLLTGLNDACFGPGRGDGWPAADLLAALAMPGVAAHALIAGADEPVGFWLARAVADEAELLLIGVRPERRRAGHGRRLIADAIATMAGAGAARLHLEVRETNCAARALYAAAGFASAGRRPAYYRTAGGDAVDALTLTCQIVAADKQARD